MHAFGGLRMGLLRDQPAFALTVLSFAIGTLRLFVLAGYHSTTAIAIVRYYGAAQIALAFLVSWLPAVSAYTALILLMRVVRAYITPIRSGERISNDRISVDPVIIGATSGGSRATDSGLWLPNSDVPTGLKVATNVPAPWELILAGISFGIAMYTVAILPFALILASLLVLWATWRLLTPVFYRLGPARLTIVMFVLLGFVAGGVVTSAGAAEVLPLERVKPASSPLVIGYVLSEDDRWIVMLREEDRLLVRVPAAGTGREFCESPGLASLKRHWWYQSFFLLAGGRGLLDKITGTKSVAPGGYPLC